jgi:hypothetical protein
MADNTIQLKRSSVAGKTPNTSTLATGELAINLTDKKLYSSDGSNIFEPAGNVTDINITGGIKANGSFGTNGYTLSTNGSGIYWSPAGAGSTTNTAPSNIKNIVNTSVNTIASVIDTANATGISTIEYLISARDNINSNYKSARILITTDGTTAFITEYGIVLSNNSAQVCSFDSDINAGNIRLIATGDSVDTDVSLQRVVLGSATEAGDIAASIILDSVTNTAINISAAANSVKLAYDTAINANTRAASAQTEASAAYTNAISYVDTANFTRTGATTFSANLTINSNGKLIFTNNAGIYANGELGTNGQILTSNGSTVHWSTIASGSALTVRSTNGSNGVVNTSVANVTGINFDESTGLHVTDQGSGNVFVSLGSGYKFITVSGQTTITAVGEDTLNVANGDNIYLTTSNTGVKTLTIGANLQSFIQNTDSRTLSGNLNFTGTNTYFSGKVTLAGNAVINAGISIIDSTGSQGTAGQVLASNGSSNVYWSTVSVGFTNGQSISVNNFVVTGAVTANGSNGTSGQILASNGTSIYWENASNAAAAYTNAVAYTDSRIIDSVTNTSITHAASANSVKNAYDRAIDANTRANSAQTAATSAYSNAVSYVDTANFTRTGITTFSANVILSTSGLSSNGSFGTNGQVLTSNGSATYWSTSAGGGGGISSLSFVGFYSGYNNPTTGTLRRYFANNITVTKMTAWVGVTSGSNLKLTLKKNGSEIANTIIAANASIANVTFSANVISDVDYLTLDLTSGSGTDIGVRIDYTPYA